VRYTGCCGSTDVRDEFRSRRGTPDTRVPEVPQQL
jgi:hypothetical protein